MPREMVQGGRDAWFDFGIGLRLLRPRGETWAAVVGLTIGVGLTVAAYGLIAAVLLAPLPFTDPDQVVSVWEQQAASDQIRVLRGRDVPVLSAAPSPFVDIAAFAAVHGTFRPPTGDVVDVSGALVSDTLFAVLGVRAAIGRTLLSGDGDPGGISPIVVSERLVRSGTLTPQLNGLVELDGSEYRLVGVMPAAFWFPDRSAVYWIPLPSAVATGAGTSFGAIARLRAGVTTAGAAAEGSGRLSSGQDRRTLRVKSYRDILAEPVQPALLALQLASGLVLLLVCLNLTWLFAARARRLSPTFAILRALGAHRRRLMVTYLTTPACIAVVSVPCAIAMAWYALRVGLALDGAVLSRIAAPAISAHVVAIGVILTCGAVAVASVAGIWLATSTHSKPETSRSHTARRRVEQVVMAIEMALVFTIASHAVLFAHVLQRMASLNVGLARTEFVVASLKTSGAVEAAAQVDRYHRIVNHLDSRGIRAAVTNAFPLTTADRLMSLGPPDVPQRDWHTMVRIRLVTPEYFDVTGLRPTTGRVLDAGDVGAHSAVVNDVFAQTILHTQDPIGMRGVEWNLWVSELTFVGVVPSVRQFSFNEAPAPELYVLYDDYISLREGVPSFDVTSAFLLAQDTDGVAQTVAAVREVAGLEGFDLEGSSVLGMRDLINAQLGGRRLLAAGAVSFAVVALVLAGLGIYGMVGHEVRARYKEIGVRLALGASPRRIALQFMRPVGIGLAVGGVAGATLLVLTGAVVRSIFAAPSGGYPAFASVVAITAVVVCSAMAAACLRPLTWVTRNDPVQSLRAD